MAPGSFPQDEGVGRRVRNMGEVVSSGGAWQDWLPEYAAEFLFSPRNDDDKYRRGVVGLVTGSPAYQGAALLGTAAAARSGAGMVRYVGPPALSNLVLLRRPEIVLGMGRVQAWVLGSGVPADKNSSQREHVRAALGENLPTVVDAGAISDALPFVGRTTSKPFIFTPHASELASMLKELGFPTSRQAIEANPGGHAIVTAQLVGATVLLKGKDTCVANQNGTALVVRSLPSVLATAGTGDVLAGLIGGLLAIASSRMDLTHPDNLAMIAATGAYIHGRAATLASQGRPIVADDISDHIPAAIAELIAR